MLKDSKVQDAVESGKRSTKRKYERIVRIEFSRKAREKRYISKRQDGDVKVETSRVVMSQTDDVGWIHHHEQNSSEGHTVTESLVSDVTPCQGKDERTRGFEYARRWKRALEVDEHEVEDKHEADVDNKIYTDDVTPRVTEKMNAPKRMSTFTSLEED